METKMEKLRIYVGGLGAGVKEDDLIKTFGSMGTVESVEFNRNKGRSFGYMDFVPASDKALAKLFSAYNGCMWKGGKLKLEKAKEDYLSRLKREWAEETELAEELASRKVDTDEKMMHALPRSKEDIENTQLRVYFPKLRKIKPLPLKGTGKHKYSFQRVEVPPLPINICDCPEHSKPPVSVKTNYTNYRKKETSGANREETYGTNIREFYGTNRKETYGTNRKETYGTNRKETYGANREGAYGTNRKETYGTNRKESYGANREEAYGENREEAYGANREEISGANDEETSGVNEEELNIMTSVLNKLLEKKDSSSKVSDKAKLTRAIHSVAQSNDPQVHEDEGGQMSDEDDLLINVVGQLRNQADLFEDWKPKRNAKQDSISLKMNTGSQKMKPMYDKKRKASASEDDTNDNRGLKRTVKASPHDTKGTSVALNSVPPESGSTQLSFDPASVRKSSWKTLLTEKGSASFRMSDILPDQKPVESGPMLIAPCSSKKDEHGDQPGKPEELENVSNCLSRKSSVSGKKSAAGSSQDDESNKNKELETRPIVEANRLSESGTMSAKGAMQDDDQGNKSKEVDLVSVVGPNKLSGSGIAPASVAVQDDQSGKSKEVEMISVVEPNKSSQSENKSVGGAAEDDQSNKNNDLKTLPAPEPNKSSESKKNVGRGASWVAKSSWLELIGNTSSSPFSISQILPSVTPQNQSSQQFGTNSISGSGYDSESKFASKDTSKPHGRTEDALIKKQDHTDLDGDKITSASVEKQDHMDIDVEHKFEQKNTQPASIPRSSLASAKRVVPEIVISETCPFMRNAASMKQWAKTKASLSGSLKKKEKEKEKGKEAEED